MLLKKMTSALIAAILIFQTLPFCPGIVTAKAEEADAIYVSVNGNDNASGSISDPLCCRICGGKGEDVYHDDIRRRAVRPCGGG